MLPSPSPEMIAALTSMGAIPPPEIGWGSTCSVFGEPSFQAGQSHMTSLPQTPDGKHIAVAKLDRGGIETRPYKNHQRRHVQPPCELNSPERSCRPRNAP